MYEVVELRMWPRSGFSAGLAEGRSCTRPCTRHTHGDTGGIRSTWPATRRVWGPKSILPWDLQKGAQSTTRRAMHRCPITSMLG